MSQLASSESLQSSLNKQQHLSQQVPVTLWHGAQYAASSKELELLRHEFGLDPHMLEKILVPRYQRHKPAASARNTHVAVQQQQELLTKLPLSAEQPSSDWILRHSTSADATNFHPWQARKFGQFDLVPWRRNKSVVDLANVLDYSSSGISMKSLQRLEKLERRQNRRRLKSARFTQQQLRRFVRIRLIFSIELRHKRMAVLRRCQLPTRVFERRPRDSGGAAAYERVLRDAYDEVARHSGYFGKRLEMQFTPNASAALRRDSDYSEKELTLYFEDDGEGGGEQEGVHRRVSAPAQLSQVFESIKKAPRANFNKAAENFAAVADSLHKSVPCNKCRDIAIKLR